MLVHHRGRHREMQRGCAAISYWLRVQLPLDRRRVIDNLQTRAACEQAEVARVPGIRRMMQKFRGKSFYDSIDIVHAQLALIDKETIRWPLPFEERHGSFDSKNPTNERSNQQGYDTEMRYEKGKMMFTPRPARESGDGEVSAEQNEPEIEPRRTVNVSARDFR